ncbi:hypothetical protein E2562_006318 [Oryza meyeriana var. granulata]|uniref:Association with the SNF1 complex (ASC) domain-containing protein n=1 Tax=Oryza meyeriana var. granulata TaxID=110450 RepID=A0A6G1EG67_9ORYZ|nr:hypothetical protein E2562_006318 [Oryza meyeriana var. granulata]
MCLTASYIVLLLPCLRRSGRRLGSARARDSWRLSGGAAVARRSESTVAFSLAVGLLRRWVELSCWFRLILSLVSRLSCGGELGGGCAAAWLIGGGGRSSCGAAGDPAGMGNAAGKEGENGHVAAAGSPAAAGVASSAEAAPRMLPPPEAVMRELPPPVPYVFTPQVPVVPLHRPTEFAPAFNNSWINESDESTNNQPQQKGIPTLITWSQGGNEVFVEGSWDNWTSRRVLERSGKDHTILLVLPSGLYHYRIIVDGEPKYVPELPHVADEGGQVANLLDVHDYIPESLDSVAEFDAPPSPEHSYDLQLPGDEEFAKEPPTLPPQLVMSVLGGTDNSEEHTPKPKHVVLNHLYIEKGWGSQSLLALGVTHRFQSKYVSFVLYKPLRR